MPVIVNTNIASINAQRSLSVVNRSLERSLERLSSGLRINKAGDDAAGLAIANGLQTQVRGLTQAVRNAGDGLSVVGAAEGAVTAQTEILQRIRELSVQAASDINSTQNRQQIQAEIDDQIQELTRIGNTVEFNGRKLIDGSFSNIDIQVGAFASQTIEVSIGDFRAAGLGKLATVDTSDATYGRAASATGLYALGAVDTGHVISTANGTGTAIVEINGFQVGSASGLDTLSFTANEGSAIAKAAAINAISTDTGVTAEATAAVRTGDNAVAAGSFTGKLIINGTEVIDGTSTAFATATNDSNSAIRNAINQKSNSTGVVATLDSANKLVLTAEDGRNVTVEVAGASSATTLRLGNTATVTTGGGLELTGTRDIAITAGDNATRAAVLGLVSDTTTAVVDPNSAVNSIDVTEDGGATRALQIIDAALDEVNSAQADLGALTNRLENTISNLEISIQNLSASESRIRDADFAAETANLTRAQIIQQSSIAVLTQANLAPQAALSLLG